MADDRRADTINLSGSDYAKVAERLRIFREDYPHSKTESAYEFEPDKSVIFTVWVWKEKAEVVELMKSGVVDKESLRSSSDANGTAQGAISGTKQKEFEKLETIALGRALAMLGYLASGEIASSEEMEEFKKFREAQEKQRIDSAIEQIKGAKSNDELNEVVKSMSSVLKYPEVVEAGKAKRVELAEKAIKLEKHKADRLDEINKPKPAAKQPLQVNPKSHGPTTAPSLPLEEPDANNN